MLDRCLAAALTSVAVDTMSSLVPERHNECLSIYFPICCHGLGCCPHDGHTSQQPPGRAEEVSGIGQELKAGLGPVVTTTQTDNQRLAAHTHTHTSNSSARTHERNFHQINLTKNVLSSFLLGIKALNADFRASCGRSLQDSGSPPASTSHHPLGLAPS